ncbi:MAG: anthranilate synthase component I, partial [Gammaproteobacteria bacterium]|nr:anthranilate synthase component I [Gammaproteobacteria bacterium]
RGTCRSEVIDPETALERVWQAIDRRKGGLFVSNYEVPDRYARWDIGFVDPPVELLVKGRRFLINALSGEGERLLPLLAAPLRGHPHLADWREGPRRAEGRIAEPAGFF